MRDPAVIRRSLPRLLAVGAFVALAGCKGDGGGTFIRSGPRPAADPLLGSRIPPQDLPIPGRDGYASRPKKDPLLGTPTRTDEPTQPAKAKGKPAEGVSRGPYLPDKGATNAALAGHLQPDDTDLSIGDRRPVGTTTGGPKGPVPLRPEGGTAGGKAVEELRAELQRYGAKWDRPAVEGGQYVARVDVPLDADQPGLVRRYEGVGPTPAAALKQVLDEVRADRGAGR